jgi:outer membrane receptor for ferrienterochelin and colicins
MKLPILAALGLFTLSPTWAADAAQNRQAQLALASAAKISSVSTMASQQSSAETSSSEEEAELLDTLSEETEVATRSKQNADFVPGVVSVLQGEELAALGKRTVLDALALVPGIEANRDADGNATLRVRNFDFFFNSGNVKVLVDSIDMAAEVSAINSAVLLMPINQVERIEVIRGPGSNLYGDFAFTGLINIVTLNNKNRVSAGMGSAGTRELVGHYAYQDDAYHAMANFSQFAADDFQSIDQAPPEERRRFGNIDIGVLGFSLRGSWMDRDSARLAPNGGAPNGGAPNGGIGRRFERLSHLLVQQQWHFGAERDAKFSAARQNANSQVGQSRYQGHEWRYAFEGQWRQGAQLWLYEIARLNQTIERGFFPAAPPPPGQRANPSIDIKNKSSVLSSIMLQDQIDLSQSLSATLGARYDALAQLDNRITPRAALVWRANDRHTLKAQYAQGFRSPTLVELYSMGMGIADDKIDFESIRTSEVAYIYRYDNGKFSATAFRANVPNAILRRPPGGPPGHENKPGPNSQGFELEWSHHWRDNLQMSASFARTRNGDPRGAGPGQAPPPSFGGPRELANVAMIWRAQPSWIIGANLLHIGKRDTPPTQFPGFNQLDLAITKQLSATVDLRFSLHNAGKDNIIYVTKVPPGRTVIADYAERTGMLELLWTW